MARQSPANRKRSKTAQSPLRHGTRKATAQSAKRGARAAIQEPSAAEPVSGGAAASVPPDEVVQAAFRAKIRMYRQGLGDCFLITLPRKNADASGAPFYMLIDCGVILGTDNAAEKMTKVVENIVTDTKGVVDVLVVTHEHWDHVSGFVQAKNSFDKLAAREVWMAWTEDQGDELANKLRDERKTGLAALRLALGEYQLSGDSEAEAELGSVLGFFGAASGGTTKDALTNAAARGQKKPPRFCSPKGSDNPIHVDAEGVKVYVLGPPHDEKQLRKINPSASDPETYGLALQGLDAFLNGAGSALTSDSEDPDRPFQSLNDIPFPVAREMDFFKQYYWRSDTNIDDWRRIDGTWLQGSAELALQLDSITNNTSLALAIELADGDVLLFAADAQVGNWLSWQDLRWNLDAQWVTGPDLLKRAIFYKVGHHGSHNATLRKQGLELMERLKVAMIPVNQTMACKKGWKHMPLQELLDTLKQKAKAVIRVDEPLPDSTDLQLRASKECFAPNEPLYYELSL